jgi:hypothetical protein
MAGDHRSGSYQWHPGDAGLSPRLEFQWTRGVHPIEPKRLYSSRPAPMSSGKLGFHGCNCFG